MWGSITPASKSLKFAIQSIVMKETKMLKMNTWSKNKSRTEFFSHLPFPFILIVIAALPGGIGYGLMLEGVFGHLGYYMALGTIGMLAMTAILMLHQDELAVNIILVIHLCIDWYLGFSLIATIMAAVLLLIFFFARSSQRPWVEPRGLWLWVLFLGITILPAIQGAITSYDASYYYPNLILGALIMFWLGTVIARDFANIRRFFQILTIFATLIAIHIILEAATGHYLLPTASVEAFLASKADYQLGTSGVTRLASFFIQPDTGGAFLALAVFIPLGLFIESSSFWKRVFYFIGMFLILIALLLTYSTGAWLATCVGIVVFLVLIGSTFCRVQIFLVIIAVATGLSVTFPSQIKLLLQHASNPSELSLRLGAWQTAINIINAFPITGVGLGFTVYEQRAESYRALAQYAPLAHPHNSYLELGAMAGCLALIVFLALLLFALWQAWHNWTQANTGTRYLLSGGIASVIALSVNSISVNAWTLPPLAAIGWMVLGIISSPLLLKKLSHSVVRKQIV